MPENHKIYDDEPVTYCSRCYSLKIKHEEVTDSDICMDCGCTETKTTDISTWERLYERRYGRKYVDRKDTAEDSIYFKMPLSRLKMCLCQSKRLQVILRKLYPAFPQGLTRTESVIVLFDRLSKDNRIDDLRYLLYSYDKNDNITV